MVRANDDAAQAFIAPQTAPTYDVPDVAAKGKQTGGVWFVKGGILQSKTANAVETFPLQAVVTTQSFPVYRVTPAGPANLNTLLVQTSQAVYAVDTRTNRWTKLDLGDDGTSVTADGETDLLPAEKGKGPFFQTTHNGDRKVIAWNPATHVFDTQNALALPRESRVLGPGENGGLWFTQAGRARVFYQAAPPAPGAPAPAPVSVVPPKPGLPLTVFADWGKNKPLAFAASGNIIWYKLYLKSDTFPGFLLGDFAHSSPVPLNVLAGYNRVRQKWTAPLPLPVNFPETVPLLMQDGAIYAATVEGNPNGSVWELGDENESAARKWRVIAPLLPREAGTANEPKDTFAQRRIMPVSVSKTEIWVLVTGRMMARYNRVAQKWDTFLLPSALRDSPQLSGPESRAPRAVQIAPHTFCLSSATGGLWRFEAGETGKSPVVWRELQPQTTLQSRVGNGPSAFSFGAVAVTPHYVWATGSLHSGQFSFAARMDKKTHQWKLWDAASGLPTRAVRSIVSEPGSDAVWVAADGGVYRLDDATAALMVRGALVEQRLVPEAARVYTGYKNNVLVADVCGMVSDAASVYLLFNRSPNTPYVEDDALLWQWKTAEKKFVPLPFPAGFFPEDQTPPAEWGRATLDEPETLWISTASEVLAWSKTRHTWERMVFPAGFPFAPPSRMERSGDALILVQDTFGFSGTVSHIIRVAAPANGSLVRRILAFAFEHIPHVQIGDGARLVVLAQELGKFGFCCAGAVAGFALVPPPKFVPPTGRLHFCALVLGDASRASAGDKAADGIAVPINAPDLVGDLAQIIGGHNPVVGCFVELNCDAHREFGVALNGQIVHFGIRPFHLPVPDNRVLHIACGAGTTGEHWSRHRRGPVHRFKFHAARAFFLFKRNLYQKYHVQSALVRADGRADLTRKCVAAACPKIGFAGSCQAGAAAVQVVEKPLAPNISIFKSVAGVVNDGGAGSFAGGKYGLKRRGSPFRFGS